MSWLGLQAHHRSRSHQVRTQSRGSKGEDTCKKGEMDDYNKKIIHFCLVGMYLIMFDVQIGSCQNRDKSKVKIREKIKTKSEQEKISGAYNRTFSPALQLLIQRPPK